MSCTDKFIISKSLPNTYTFVIKQQESTLPMLLDASDTFVGHLYRLDTNEEDTNVVLTITKETPYENGKVSMEVTNTATLQSDRGDKADRYYLLPTYKLVIECDTVNNGQFIAKVDKVYVDV